MSPLSIAIVQKAISTLSIIYVAFLFSSFVYLLIGFFLSRANWAYTIADPFLTRTLLGVFAAISVVMIVWITKLREKAFAEDMPRPQNLDQLQRYAIAKFVIFFALAEVPAILGLVLFLLIGNFSYLLILWALSMVCFAIARPSKTALTNLASRYGNLS